MNAGCLTKFVLLIPLFLGRHRRRLYISSERTVQFLHNTQLNRFPVACASLCAPRMTALRHRQAAPGHFTYVVHLSMLQRSLFYAVTNNCNDHAKWYALIRLQHLPS
jgi:hypothetical protein